MATHGRNSSFWSHMVGTRAFGQHRDEGKPNVEPRGVKSPVCPSESEKSQFGHVGWTSPNFAPRGTQKDKFGRVCGKKFVPQTDKTNLVLRDGKTPFSSSAAIANCGPLVGQNQICSSQIPLPNLTLPCWKTPIPLWGRKNPIWCFDVEKVQFEARSLQRTMSPNVLGHTTIFLLQIENPNVALWKSKSNFGPVG